MALGAVPLHLGAWRQDGGAAGIDRPALPHCAQNQSAGGGPSSPASLPSSAAEVTPSLVISCAR